MATIYDVARAAGVTAATVSVALSGRGVVSGETRARVLRCAEELGYRPNLVARSLSTRKTCTIGLIVSNITNPFYAEVALAVEQRAHQAGYRVFFANTDGDPELGIELLEDLAARRVDGVIAVPGGLPAGAVRAAAGAGLPIVPCLWEEEEGAGLAAAVGFDYAAAGRLVADHLAALGHRRIGTVVIWTPDVEPIRLRATAFRDRLTALGRPLDMALWQWGNQTVEDGYRAAQALLALPDPPTAIFATNDLMALGVLAAARELGVRVPAELSVVGFDDIALARYAAPPLTTVRIERTALMATATDLLLRMIRGEVVVSPALQAPELIARESSAPAPARAHSREREGVIPA